MDLATAVSEPSGQGWAQLADLGIAFGLSAVIGLERQIRHKSAGLRTQTIVGTTAALILLVSKYGFSDVLVRSLVVVDPSRVAAQVVSGVGFLGAGLILTRRGAVKGLTTAATVWEAAGVGLAAGAGLPLLAAAVTGLHLLAIFAFTPLTRRLGSGRSARRLEVRYRDGQGVLREVLGRCGARGWTVTELRVLDEGAGLWELGGASGGDGGAVAVALTLNGAEVQRAPGELGALDGVLGVAFGADEEE